MGNKEIRITETDSLYQDIEKMETAEILSNINNEDQKVALAVQQVIPTIQVFVDQAYERLQDGGRLFYIGAGTSGRLGVLDASECPPTFGVSAELVTGIIAGGDKALRSAVEFAEDSEEMAWKDLQFQGASKEDVVIGIAASGTTPYVIHGLLRAKEAGLLTACITCNENSPLSTVADHPIEVVVGPEFITGSTRMKSGTAQKFVLNMISTTLMVKLGRIKGNKMVDMALSNKKLVERGVRMIVNATGIEEQHAQALLQRFGSVRAVLNQFGGI